MNPVALELFLNIFVVHLYVFNNIHKMKREERVLADHWLLVVAFCYPCLALYIILVFVWAVTMMVYSFLALSILIAILILADFFLSFLVLQLWWKISAENLFTCFSGSQLLLLDLILGIHASCRPVRSSVKLSSPTVKYMHPVSLVRCALVLSIFQELRFNFHSCIILVMISVPYYYRCLTFSASAPFKHRDWCTEPKLKQPLQLGLMISLQMH